MDTTRIWTALAAPERLDFAASTCNSAASLPRLVCLVVAADLVARTMVAPWSTSSANSVNLSFLLPSLATRRFQWPLPLPDLPFFPSADAASRLAT